jgi:hypothetical protein
MMNKDKLSDKILKIQRLVADGKHNAFTSLIFWKEYYYLTYRSSNGHAQNDGNIEMLRSKDLEHWERIVTAMQEDRNYYEGHLIAYKDKLLMFGGAFDRSKSVFEQKNSSEYVSFSEDGIKWSSPLPVKTVDCGWRFWHPIEIEGVLYVAAYRTDRSAVDVLGTIPSDLWEVELMRSPDGINWESASSISTGEAGNETELFMDSQGILHAFVRRENKPTNLAEYRARFPFTEWSGPFDFGEAVQGQVVREVNGRLFMIGRHKKSSTLSGTIFEDRSGISAKCWVQDIAGLWVHYLTLPAGGDCSYPGIVQLTENSMLVSWYSQHEYLGSSGFKDMESASDIFIAEIRTDLEPEWGRLTGYGRTKLDEMKNGEKN